MGDFEEQVKEDAKNAETLHGDLKTKVALLQRSNTELRASLDLSSSRIAELEAEVLKSSQASSELDLGYVHIPEGLACASSEHSLRGVAPVPVATNGSGPTPAAPVASQIRQITALPNKERSSPLETRSSGRQVPGPVLGARIQKLLQPSPRPSMHHPRVLPREYWRRQRHNHSLREPCRSGGMAASPKATGRRHNATTSLQQPPACHWVDEKP